MKFQSIELKNFMRYKGTNKIEFSCDDQRNVTVILGDNTVGKTTIAQAFRWCLYGAIMVERGKTQNDYQLLNNSVLECMDANSRAVVFVEIVAKEAERQYIIRREIWYTRAFPKLIAKEFQKKLSVKIAENDEVIAEIESGAEEELINELFPKNLSHYFLFDGERWNDVTVNGVKENIKESVHILTGLSAYQSALNHLKDMGGSSAIGRFKGRIKGGGNIYDNLQQDMKRCGHEVEQLKQKIEVLDINITNDTKKIHEIEEFLDTNKETELLQARDRQLRAVRKAQEEKYISSYKYFVNGFSEKAYMLFAQSMIKASLEMVKAAAGERRDIPHMRQSSIDHIIKTGRCICGTRIEANSEAYQCLMEQRNYLPPADIGSLLGEFERTANQWMKKTSDLTAELREAAQEIDNSLRDYENTKAQIKLLEKKMDARLDFAEPKNQLRRYRDDIQRFSAQKGELQGRIRNYEKQMANLEESMKSQEAQSQENKKWRSRIDLAEVVYRRMKEDFQKKERETFQQINQEIQHNFERMFNAKDKRIQLTDQYEIQMMYKKGEGFREERNLSEGEKIARNFAFIVTIMDYSQRKKREKSPENMENDTLPLVLDGPFSKLGDENIELVAKVLPEVSEQVIIFMLRKDWEYTRLDEYVGATYSIDKAADQSFASIRRTGGIL